MKKTKTINTAAPARTGALFLRTNVGGLLVAFLMFFAHWAEAQIKVVPLQRDLPTSASPDNTHPVATASSHTLLLPFWDDFSFTPVNDTARADSNAPLEHLWKHGKTVWVNNGAGINPPTINVATFDGIDSLGIPYSQQVLDNGFADKLVSHPINLAAVAPADTSTVYLSFFYQRQGNGEPPDAPDFLRVEFKNVQNQWETVHTIYPDASMLSSVFYFAIIKVKGQRFFHSGFQMRFRNFGRQSGPFDTWHIDYVYLNKKRDANDKYFPDVALTTGVSPLFGKYTVMPLDHFHESAPIATPQMGVYNMRSYPISVKYSAVGVFTHYFRDKSVTKHTATLAASEFVGGDNPPNGIVGATSTNVIVLRSTPDPDDPQQFDPDVDSLTLVHLKFKLFSGDVLQVGTNDTTAEYKAKNYRPIDFRANDTTSVRFALADYYAYDDGTAENAVLLNKQGNLAACMFEILRNEKDTLISFDIYIPRYSVVGNLTGDFNIYSVDDANGAPGTLLYSISSRAIKRKERNEFQTIILGEPIVVPKKFFIGWEATSAGSLHVGLDTNNDSGDRIYANWRGQWELNTEIRGSLMIRPRFGEGEPPNGIEDEEAIIAAYPNPSKGEFYIDGSIEHLEILSVTGQRIAYTKESVYGRSRISLTNATSGMYILRLKHGRTISTQKVIIY